MAAEISAITYFAPIATFLIVVAIVFAVLIKTKILGDHKLGVLLLAFLVAVIFISAGGSIKFIGAIVPAFAVLIVSLVFLLAMLAFIGKSTEFLNKGIGIAVLIIFTLIVLISGFIIYSNFIIGYLPGPMFGHNVNQDALPFFSWLYSPRVAGAILLIITSAIVGWILVKVK